MRKGGPPARDPETGNDYAFARYYSQREERFLSPDPLGGSSGDPQTLDKYAYARNNPTNLTDPSGLWPCDGDCGGIGICFGCGGGEDGSGKDPRDGPRPPSYSPAEVAPNSNESDGESSSDPWVFGCESLGMPCGMQFPVTGGGPDLSGCTYGSGSCGGWAMGWTKDPNGNIVGNQGNGEQLCPENGACLYWNSAQYKWLDWPTWVLTQAGGWAAPGVNGGMVVAAPAMIMAVGPGALEAGGEAAANNPNVTIGLSKGAAGGTSVPTDPREFIGWLIGRAINGLFR